MLDHTKIILKIVKHYIQSVLFSRYVLINLFLIILLESWRITGLKFDETKQTESHCMNENDGSWIN